MTKIQLTLKQVLECVILGIKNGNYQAAINIAQDCINEIDTQAKTNQPLDFPTLDVKTLEGDKGEKNSNDKKKD